MNMKSLFTLGQETYLAACDVFEGRLPSAADAYGFAQDLSLSDEDESGVTYYFDAFNSYAGLPENMPNAFRDGYEGEVRAAAARRKAKAEKKDRVVRVVRDAAFILGYELVGVPGHWSLIDRVSGDPVVVVENVDGVAPVLEHLAAYAKKEGF